MTRILRGAAVLLLGAGCADPSAPGGPSGSAGGATHVGIANTPEGSGWLRVRVRWPERSLPGFNAQAIPGRTRAIRLTTLDAGRQVADLRTLVRSADLSGESTASLRLAAGAGYAITAEAFEQAEPADDATPIAAGSAVNLTIRASTILAVPLTLTAAGAPSISSLSVTAGPHDTPLTIVGRHFGATPGLPWHVTIGGMRVPAIRRDDTRIEARVPEGARGGQVVVWVDEVPSTTVARFTVTQGLGVEVVSDEDMAADHGLTVDLDEALPGGLELWLDEAPGESSGAELAEANPEPPP
jgi:hypothetical protein